jgi:hypothetical protein
MKILVGSLALIAALSSANAGGFGGPPPFTNGSPLISGTDGSYQASVRGNNTSGIVRFSMSGGTQSSEGNNYAIFSEGIVYTGNTQASIMTSNISAVLETSGTVTGHSLRGFFNGKLSQNSVYGSFSGKGEIVTNNGVLRTLTTSVTSPLVVKNPDGTTTTTDSSSEVSTEDLNHATKIQIKVKGVRTTTTLGT